MATAAEGRAVYSVVCMDSWLSSTRTPRAFCSAILSLAMRTISLTTYYLEMRNRDEFRPKWSVVPEFQIQPVRTPCPEFNRFLYCAVGWPWYWLDRLPWSYE